MAQRAQLEQWQLEGSSAEAYEQYLVPAIFAPMAERLIDYAGLRAGERVLDAGCGTGIVARHAASRVGAEGSVVGIDLNPGMLNVARRVASESGLAIEWRQGNLEEMPFPRSTFDAVLCQQALQFVPDPLAALREIHRVLAPEKRLAWSVLRSVGHNSGYGRVAEVFARHVGEDLAAMMRSPFPAWDINHLRGLLSDAGFQKMHIQIDIAHARFPSVAEFLRRETASSPLGEVIASLDAEVRDAMVRDIGAELQSYIDDERIVLPLETHLVLTHR